MAKTREPANPSASAWLAQRIGSILEPDAAVEASRGPLLAFRRFLLLHGFARSWLWVSLAPEVWAPGLIATAVVMTLAFGLAWSARSAWLAPRVALPALAAQLALTFPLTDNHFVLELYAAGLLCLLGRGDRDADLVLGSLRWLCVVVLFHTGFQKLLYGQYFDGQFLAFMVAQGERFAALFSLIVPDPQLERLQGYDALRTGQGPFRVDSWLFVAASNAVWVLEMGLAGLLAVARTRFVAALASIALVAGIQLAAREFGFALLFVNMLLLFTARGNERALPGVALVYFYALVAASGLLPEAFLDRSWL